MSLIFVLLIVNTGQNILIHPKPPTKILIISSYNEYDPCGREQIAGITDEFEREFNPGSLAIQVEYMRARKLNLTNESRQMVADSFFRIFKRLHPRVIFLVDDIAIEYMLPKLVCEKCNYLIVFSGMNRDIKFYNKRNKFIERWIGEKAVPSKNVTGVIEKIYIKLSVRYAMKILSSIVTPRKDTVVFLMGKDNISQLVKRQITRELIGFNDINWKFMEAGTFEEFLNSAKIIEEDPNIPFYYPLTLAIDSAGKILGMNDLIPHYTRYMKKPGITLNKFFCQLGLFGGVGLNFYAMGQKAAQKAISYLSGTSINKILIENADSVETTFNIKRARQLNVKIPLGAILNATIIQK